MLESINNLNRGTFNLIKRLQYKPISRCPYHKIYDDNLEINIERFLNLAKILSKQHAF